MQWGLHYSQDTDIMDSMSTPDADVRTDISDVVRARLRALRLAQAWSLDDLAERTHLGASTLSRIETGSRTIGLDVLGPLCEAFRIDMATLLDMSGEGDDVVIRPQPTAAHGRTTWLLTRDDSSRNVVAAKWRLEPSAEPPSQQVHPGHDWFFVLSGTIQLDLGDRTLMVHEGEAAEFSTMTPHSMMAVGGVAEIVTIFDRTGHQAHDGPHT